MTIDKTDDQPLPLLQRVALVEISTEYGTFTLVAPVFDFPAEILGVPMTVTATVTGIAQGFEAALSLVEGLRRRQATLAATDAGETTAVRH